MILSSIACSNLMHLFPTVPEILHREIWKIVYKMATSGRTEEASDVKFGVRASFIELYLWSKFGDPSSYGVQTQMPSRRRRRRVRVLCHKRLRQLRWARVLKIETRSTADAVERPSPVMGISENTQIILICRCRGFNKHFHLLSCTVVGKRRRKRHAKFG